MKIVDCLSSIEDALFSVSEETPSEVVLWRAVILQQLVDAGSNSGLHFMKKRKKDAIRWLMENSRDFQEVCYMANLDPHHVRKYSKFALARNCRWRKYNKNSYEGRSKKR